MRIVIHDFIAYPFTVQLARSLAARGHQVLYLYGGGIRAPRGVTEDEEISSLAIERVELDEPLRKSAGPRRLLQERRYGAALRKRIRAFQPAVVLATQSSLDGQAAAMRAAREANAGFVYWLQDIYSEAIARLLARGVPLAGRVIGARFARLERRLLRESDAVVTITDDFMPVMARWGVSPDQVHLIPNWAPLDEIEPLPKTNSWAREKALHDMPVFLYSGTLGRKHDPRWLIALADGFPQSRVVVVSEGAGTDRLRALAGDRGNLLTLPLQPIDRLKEVLATADILVALLDPDANVFSVPSKVLTYLTAGRPILAAVPSANLAARTVLASGAGSVVEPTNLDRFVDEARRLLEDSSGRARMGDAGRAYAERAFAIEPITDRFERVLAQAARRLHSHTAQAADTAGAP